MMTVAESPLSPPAADNPDVPAEPIYRLTVAQYHAMADHGILDENDPGELLEGWLVRKMTKHPPHTLATLLVRRALERLLAEGWYVNSREPITTSESEPDVFVARGDPRQYRDRHPGSGEVALVVEVADTSLRTDRGAKQRIYARAGIGAYWILNLPEDQIEVYSDPSGPADPPGYRQRQVFGTTDELLLLLDGIEIGRLTVRELLL